MKYHFNDPYCILKRRIISRLFLLSSIGIKEDKILSFSVTEIYTNDYILSAHFLSDDV